MAADLYKQFFDLAVQCKIKEDDIPNWVQTRVDAQLERDERAAKRAHESELRSKELELEAEKTKREIESEKTKREIESEKTKREIETKKLEIEAEKTKQMQLSSKTPDQKTHLMIPKLKLQPLVPSDYATIDLFLEKFERTCSHAAYDKSLWGTYLLTLVSGDALQVISSMSTEESKDYDCIKRKLLTRFGCDTHGFRSKFFNSKPQVDETFESFLYRSKRFFDRWLELSSVANYESLYFLILSDLILGNCDDDFVAFIRDRTPDSVGSLIKYASVYTTSRPNKPFVKKIINKVSFAGVTPVSAEQSTNGRHDSRLSRSPRRESTRRSASRSVSRSPDRSSYSSFRRHSVSPTSHSQTQNNVCRVCNGVGHYARVCPSQSLTRDSTSSRPSPVNVHRPVSQVVTCSYCKRPGHIRSKCFSLFPHLRQTSGYMAYTDTTDTSDSNLFCCSAASGLNRDGSLALSKAKVFGKDVTLLRDTGCNTVAVREDLVPADALTGRVSRVTTFCCKNRRFPTAIIFLESDYFTGQVEACVLKDSVAGVILGNIQGVADSNTRCAYVSTRSQTRSSNVDHHVEQSLYPHVQDVRPQVSAQAREFGDPVASSNVHGDEPSHINSDVDLTAIYSDFAERQRQDVSLSSWYNRVDKDPVSGISFVLDNGFLYRLFRKPGSVTYRKTLCVPESLRVQVMEAAHEVDLSGHSGFRKTLANIKEYFSWPGISVDALSFVRSCHVCQIKAPVGRDRPAPFQSMPLIVEPFSRVVIDLVGPLPMSSGRFEYILTLVDVATRYAEAAPLRHITAKDVADALFPMFARLGFPLEIQSDRGSQFMSGLIKELNVLSGVKHIFSTPFHPETNALVERFHGTLKSMLRKLSHESPTSWDKYLCAALYAYRSQVHASTGFSPFFLLFGRAPRGPMAILHDLFTRQDVSPDAYFQYHYVIDLHNKIKSCCRIAQESAHEVARASMLRQAPKSLLKVFRPGDLVMVLLPQSNNKLILQLQGPFPVVKQMSPVNYVVDLGSRLTKLHVNLLRKYYPRSQQSSGSIDTHHTPDNPQAFTVTTESTEAQSQERLAVFENLPLCTHGFFEHTFLSHDHDVTPQCTSVNVTDEELTLKFTNDITFAPPNGVAYVSAVTEDPSSIGGSLPTPSTTETKSKVKINPYLDSCKLAEVYDILTDFSDVLTAMPGHTSSIVHNIELTTDEPIRIKPYPLPFSSQEFVREEVAQLLELGVIEPSTSSYCSPIVLVKKKEGTLRLCIDFRKLNQVTKFDANNIPLPEDLFVQLANSTVFSSCDLSRAYWQVPLHPDCRHYTAFQTPLGLMQWIRMPFGLVTAPATFCRLMRIVLKDIPDLLSYFDDTLVHTPTWAQHPAALRALFTALRAHGLTVNPQKLSIGQTSIEFLGHVVSNGSMLPAPTKVKKVLSFATPTTKRQVQSLMGLLNYYRAFIPAFSEITRPLTDLVRKNLPDKIKWSDECDQAFSKVSKILSSDPILIIPDINEPFVIRTDASDYGIGAVLLQYRHGLLMPCRYASKKLCPAEMNYSAIERECLAIIYAVKQFYKFLAFRHFEIQTDHKPLVFLKKGSVKNSRLMRWALILQEFSFSIIAIPGGHNVHGDALSRLI